MSCWLFCSFCFHSFPVHSAKWSHTFVAVGSTKPQTVPGICTDPQNLKAFLFFLCQAVAFYLKKEGRTEAKGSQKTDFTSRRSFMCYLALSTQCQSSCSSHQRYLSKWILIFIKLQLSGPVNILFFVSYLQL